LLEHKNNSGEVDEKQIPKKETSQIELNISQSKDKPKSSQEKMKLSNMNKEDLFKLIGSSIYIIYVMSTCMGCIFNAHGLNLLFILRKNILRKNFYF
jgi:hypothetical protein